MLLVCAFAVGANVHCYFSWQINCFSKSSWVINIKNAGSRLDFRISKLNLFNFQLVFLATIFILLRNAEKHCVTRQKRLQGSFENTIYKAILVNKLKLGSVTLAAGFHSRNTIKLKKNLATSVRFRDKKLKKGIGPWLLADLCYASICALGLDKE